MLVSKVTGSVGLKDDITVSIRKLSAKRLREASEARSSGAARNAKDWGAELVEMFAKADTPEGKAERERKAAAPEARYERYDRAVAFRYGVTGWEGADEKLLDLEDQLDAEDADKVYRAIIDLSVPTLAEAEAALKNG